MKKGSKRFVTGDVIKVYSNLSHISPVPIWHYGIVTDEDEVVHFNLAEENMEIRIIQTDINRFVNGGTRLQICQISAMHKKYSPEEIVYRALSQVGSDFGGYNLLTNNCEHFANWCSCGEKFSNQVPVDEGTDHSIGDKIFENIVVDPVMQTLDNMERGIDDLFDKTDEFFDWLGKVRFPWE